MLTSLFSAVSGMNANGEMLSVIGDNIANVNTVGFKGSRVAFGDILSQSLIGVSGTSQIGRGVLTSDVSPLFTQGSFETTGSALDLAIEGDGFFIVEDGDARYYTRAGQFTLDKNGNVVNPEGLILQGFLADTGGNITGTTGDLNIATTQSPANMTTSANLALNLNSTQSAPTAAFTLDGNGDSIPNDPENFNSSTTVTVYDSQGGAHQVTAYFVKTADNTWDVHYVYDDPTNPDQLLDAGTQALTFSTAGSLVDDNSGTIINFNFGAAVTTPQPVTFNYGTGTGESPAGDGLDGTTQFATEFSVSNLSQDGYGAGSLENLTISEEGIITGIFTNGQTRVLAQVALARFISPTGLIKLGGNLYSESFDSGQPIVGAPQTSGLGRLLSNSLELSNVDLAEEFVKMISAQRAFQANARTISVTDEITQELVNLRR